MGKLVGIVIVLPFQYRLKGFNLFLWFLSNALYQTATHTRSFVWFHTNCLYPIWTYYSRFANTIVTLWALHEQYNMLLLDLAGENLSTNLNGDKEPTLAHRADIFKLNRLRDYDRDISAEASKMPTRYSTSTLNLSKKYHFSIRLLKTYRPAWYKQQTDTFAHKLR